MFGRRDLIASCEDINMQTSLLCIVDELAGGGSVAVAVGVAVAVAVCIYWCQCYYPQALRNLDVSLMRDFYTFKF